MMSKILTTQKMITMTSNLFSYQNSSVSVDFMHASMKKASHPSVMNSLIHDLGFSFFLLMVVPVKNFYFYAGSCKSCLCCHVELF